MVTRCAYAFGSGGSDSYCFDNSGVEIMEFEQGGLKDVRGGFEETLRFIKQHQHVDFGSRLMEITMFTVSPEFTHLAGPFWGDLACVHPEFEFIWPTRVAWAFCKQ